MITRLLAGAAYAALLGAAMPISAATNPELPGAAVEISPSAAQAVSAFYASRHGAPLWLHSGGDSGAARALIGILDRAQLDGLESGPALASQAQSLLMRAQAGDTAASSAADRLLSEAWISYVAVLQRPTNGMIYADSWAAPRRDSPMQILQRAAAAESLAGYIRSVSQVNPLYAQLRDAAWAEAQSSGGNIDPRVLASLDRARERPFQHKYIMVDAAAARLYMIEDGRIADSMKVVVGKAGATTQTPMVASTIYYATLNPYWHVSSDLVRSLIAKNVLDQGFGYLTSHGYQVMPADENDDRLLDPAKVDWHAVANGSLQVRVRELPGPANSMGRVKFGFPNAYDIYLHDTPVKDLFAQDDRTLSHGCIRLEDAERLARWMMGRDPKADSSVPEQNVTLPTPVPIYVTYLTAQVNNGQLSFVDDIYGRDEQATRVAALR
ncbi:MAG TPA: L,D-transpeptidase family protein [Sphingomicrobium sp.]|jgi:murein L,D-transpeptidase YcbB/YkuD|nr:L,D-transpeptidase family protein [Sphingomicrobium sp.]